MFTDPHPLLPRRRTILDPWPPPICFRLTSGIVLAGCPCSRQIPEHYIDREPGRALWIRAPWNSVNFRRKKPNCPSSWALPRSRTRRSWPSRGIRSAGVFSAIASQHPGHLSVPRIIFYCNAPNLFPRCFTPPCAMKISRIFPFRSWETFQNWGPFRTTSSPVPAMLKRIHLIRNPSETVLCTIYSSSYTLCIR